MRAFGPVWFNSLERGLADAMAERLLIDVGTDSRTHGLGLSAVLSMLLALPVHLLSVVPGVAGVALLIGSNGVALRVFGALLVAMAVVLRPALPKLPAHVARLTREEAPELFTLLDDIAVECRCSAPAEVLVTSAFNGFAVRVGWRRRALGIGAPLWVASPPQARIALLAHEMGHIAHGDLLLGRVVGSARDRLRRWALLPAPLGWCAGAYLWLLTILEAPAHRRMETYADLASGRVAGTEGERAAYDALLAWPSISTVLNRVAMKPERPDVWVAVRRRMAATTYDEVASRRISASYVRNRMDSRHPATVLRLRLLGYRPPTDGTVRRSETTWLAIDRELAPALALAADEVCAGYRYVV